MRRDTAVAVETAKEVAQKQSIEVVQTLLHSSVSELLYMRLLLPDESFINIDYPFKADVDYEAFSRGEHVDRNPSRGHRTKIHLILRNRSPGGDMLLDWLQKGAFEALQRRWLMAMQLSVHTGSKEPKRVVESYTFSITYLEPSEDGQSVSVGFDSPNGRRIELKDIRYALHTILRQLAGICKALPQLPDRRYLSMNLFYTSDCPHDYQPALFQHSDATEQDFACSKDWTPKSACVGLVNSGYHQVSLSLASLSTELEGCPSATEACTIPPVLDQTVQRLSDSDVVKLVASHIQPMSEANLPPTIAAQASQTATIMEESARKGLGHIETTEVGRILVQDTKDNSQQTALMRNESLTMLDSHQASKSLEATQLVPQGLGSSQDDNRSLSREVALAYSHATLRELRGCSASSDEARAYREEWISITDDIDVHDIHCLCGNKHGTRCDDLLNCNFCGRWQHVHCHGFRGIDDERIPSLHVCYACLLNGRDEETLQRLGDLSLLRNVVNILEREGRLNITSLSEKMSSKVSIARDAVKRLKAKQVLRFRPKRRSKGASRSDARLISLVKDGEAHHRMLSELFDPTAEIADHLNPATEQASLPMSTSSIADAMETGTPSEPPTQHSKRPVDTETVEASVSNRKKLKLTQSRGELNDSHWSPGSP